jgi:hypothetical protein
VSLHAGSFLGPGADPAALTRLQTLWETRRRAAIEAAQHDRDSGEDENPASELAAFASWFRSVVLIPNGR